MSDLSSTIDPSWFLEAVYGDCRCQSSGDGSCAVWSTRWIPTTNSIQLQDVHFVSEKVYGQWTIVFGYNWVHQDFNDALWKQFYCCYGSFSLHTLERVQRSLSSRVIRWATYLAPLTFGSNFALELTVYLLSTIDLEGLDYESIQNLQLQTYLNYFSLAMSEQGSD